jgi:small subunit ribosomal protein S16
LAVNSSAKSAKDLSESVQTPQFAGSGGRNGWIDGFSREFELPSIKAHLLAIHRVVGVGCLSQFSHARCHLIWRFSLVRIRMQRYGRRNRPFYRIAAVEKRVRRDGPVLENLGWYNPLAPDASKQLELNNERVQYWLDKGAQPSETMRDFLAKRGLGDLKAWEADRATDRKLVEERKAKAAAEGAEKKA